MHRALQSLRNRFRRKHRCCGGVVSLSGTWWWLRKRDFDDPIDPEELGRKYAIRDELGWKERLDLMWRVDEFGSPSPELAEVLTSASFAAGICFVYGGMRGGSKAYSDFVAANKYTMFKSPRQAQKIVHEVSLLHFCRSGLSLGWKAGLFAGCFFGIANTLCAVFNSVNPLHHMFAGFVTAATWRTMGGPRAMMASGALGSIFGFAIGSSTWMGSQISGEPLGKRWMEAMKEAQKCNDARVEDLNKQRKENPISPLFARPDSKGDAELEGSVAAGVEPEGSSSIKRSTYEQDIYKNEGDEAPLMRRIIIRLRWLFGLNSPDLNPDIIPDNQPFGRSLQSFTVYTWMDDSKTDEQKQRDKELRGIHKK